MCDQRHLSLSTNNIDRIAGLTGMASLEILSLGRNQVKKLEGLDGIAETLQQLWISYNLLEKMVNSYDLSYVLYMPYLGVRCKPLERQTWKC